MTDLPSDHRRRDTDARGYSILVDWTDSGDRARRGEGHHVTDSYPDQSKLTDLRVKMMSHAPSNIGVADAVGRSLLERTHCSAVQQCILECIPAGQSAAHRVLPSGDSESC